MRINSSHLSRLLHLRVKAHYLRLSFKMFTLQFKKLVALVLVCVIVKVTDVLGKPTENILGSMSNEHHSLEHDPIYEVTPLCTHKKHVINPNDLIKSVEDGFVFDENFSQTIEVEMCENVGSPCSHYPLMKTRCKQKYLSIQLQVVSRNSTLSQLKSFTIPSNCECAYLRL